MRPRQLLQLEHANKLEKNVLKHNKSSGQLECTWIGLLCGKNRSTSVTSITINGESARHYQCQGGTISATPFLGPLPPYLASTKSDR